MRIAVVVTSVDQKLHAGVRIRYVRLKEVLAKLGCSLNILSIDEISHSSLDYKFFLFSKCYDARSAVLIEKLRSQGSLIGVDIFDDYFSEAGNKRFLKYIYWSKFVSNQINFILCSTDEIKTIASEVFPKVPIHVLNDPVANVDYDALANLLRDKILKIKKEKKIKIAWFGMGDNPIFKVGLHDLYSFSDIINNMKGNGYEISIEILTNKRAMTTDNMYKLSSLGVDYSVGEWTEDGEVQLLSESFLSFIPVNSQNFSRVKSLNRALTSLTSGVQVITAGYPLYMKLNDFIYTTPGLLFDDISADYCLLNPLTIKKFKEKINELASAEVESVKLYDFLSSINGDNHKWEVDFGVLHGLDSQADVHKFTQKNKKLSMATPFASNTLNYDVRYVINSSGGLDVLFNKKAHAKISKKFSHAVFLDHTSADKQSYIFKEGSGKLLINSLSRVCPNESIDLIYPHIFSEIKRLSMNLFGLNVFLSENSKSLSGIYGFIIDKKMP